MSTANEDNSEWAEEDDVFAENSVVSPSTVLGTTAHPTTDTATREDDTDEEVNPSKEVRFRGEEDSETDAEEEGEDATARRRRKAYERLSRESSRPSDDPSRDTTFITTPDRKKSYREGIKLSGGECTWHFYPAIEFSRDSFERNQRRHLLQQHQIIAHGGLRRQKHKTFGGDADKPPTASSATTCRTQTSVESRVSTHQQERFASITAGFAQDTVDDEKQVEAERDIAEATRRRLERQQELRHQFGITTWQPKVVVSINIKDVLQPEVDRHLRSAQEYLEQQIYNRALLHTQKGIVLAPQLVQWFQLKVRIYEEMTDFASAIINLRRVISIHKKNSLNGKDNSVELEKLRKKLAFLHFVHGQQLFDSGLFIDALREFTNATINDPERQGYQMKCIHCMSSMGRYRDSITLVGYQLETYPDNADLHLLMARLYQITNDVPNVYRFIESGLAIDAEHVGILRFNEAFKRRAEVLLGEAMELALKGRDEEAEAKLSVCIDMDPRSADFNFKRSVVRRRLGRLQAAIGDVATAIEKLRVARHAARLDRQRHVTKAMTSSSTPSPDEGRSTGFSHDGGDEESEEDEVPWEVVQKRFNQDLNDYQLQLINCYNDLAVESVTQSQLELAIDILNKAIKFDASRCAQAVENGLHKASQGGAVSRSNAVRKAVNISDDDHLRLPQLFLNRADCYSRLGKTRFALADYDTALHLATVQLNDDLALETRKKVADMFLRLGEALLERRLFKKAAAEFTKALRFAAIDDVAEFHLLRCRARLMLDDEDGARDDFIAALLAHNDTTSEDVPSMSGKRADTTLKLNQMRQRLFLGATDDEVLATPSGKRLAADRARQMKQETDRRAQRIRREEDIRQKVAMVMEERDEKQRRKGRLHRRIDVCDDDAGEGHFDASTSVVGGRRLSIMTSSSRGGGRINAGGDVRRVSWGSTSSAPTGTMIKLDVRRLKTQMSGLTALTEVDDSTLAGSPDVFARIESYDDEETADDDTTGLKGELSFTVLAGGGDGARRESLASERRRHEAELADSRALVADRLRLRREIEAERARTARFPRDPKLTFPTTSAAH